MTLKFDTPTFNVVIMVLISEVCTFTVSVVLKKVKRSRYRPGVAQRVGRGIALLFHDRGTRRG